MSGPRHMHRRARLAYGMPVGAVLGAGILGLGVSGGTLLALHSGAATAGRCDNPVVVTVATSAQLADPLTRLAASYTQSAPAVGDRCVRVDVTVRDSTQAATALADDGTSADLGADVWVPDSQQWVTLARRTAAGAAALPASSPSVASSPTVIASPRPMGTAIGWPRTQLSWRQMSALQTSTTYWAGKGHKEWGPFTVGLADPIASMASLQSLVGLTAVQEKTSPATLTADTFAKDRGVQLTLLSLEHRSDAVTDTQAQLFDGVRKADQAGTPTSYVSAFPIQESDLIAYNQGRLSGGSAPTVGLVASYPSDGLFVQQVPYVVGTATTGDTARAAAGFLGELKGAAGQKALAAAGFRTSAGTAAFTPALGVQAKLPVVDTATASGNTLAAAQAFFHRVHQRGAVLALFDISGSMNDPVAGTVGTKFDLAVQAALSGLNLFAQNDLLGLWGFSTNQVGKQPWKQFSPVVALDSPGRYGTHADDLRQLADVIKPSGDTGLYESVLAAYQARTKAYVPGRLNEIVLLSDGDEDYPAGNPNPITLTQLVSRLTAMYDPAKPVHIITIAYGTDGDPAVLKQISDATKAKTYRSADPSKIFDVFINALLQST